MQRVIYIEASQTNPNSLGIDEVCREMAAQELELVHVSSMQGVGGATVGLWLFFSSDQERTTQDMLALSRRLESVVNPLPSHPSDSPGSWLNEAREKKGLGVSLVVTGACAVIIGVILHFALRNNVIETSLHLGYYFGVFGLIVFLIGLLIVF